MTIKLAHGYLQAEKVNGSGWYIHSIVVDEGYQGKGIGTRLMVKAIKKCEGQIYLLVSGEFGGDIEQLYGFYKSFGFKKCKGNHIGYNYNMIL